MLHPSGVPPLPPFGGAPLVGRGQQLTRLLACLQEARQPTNAGRPNVVLLAGAPGIGKTRLLNAFPPTDVAAGTTVLRGGASQAVGLPPYLPFLQALGDYIAAAPLDILRDQLGPHGTTLSALFSEIALRLGPLPPSHPLGPEQARFRLYEAVAAFLASLAVSGPLVLVLDDLQWADAASCDLLVHLANRLFSSSFLIVGAYRDSETAGNPPLLRTLAELNRRRLLLTLRLPPLDEHESRSLAANLLQDLIAPELADMLQRHAEGNPFFLEELLRALLDDGALVWQTDRWGLDKPASLLPPQVAEAIRMRLDRLDQSVVAVLRVAAVFGRTFDPTLLATLADLDGEQLDERLMHATHAQIIRPETNGTYVFTHNMIRETIRASVGQVRRQRLHQAIGEALEAQENKRAPQRLAELAFHFAEAGDAPRGVIYALAAGKQALQASAAVDAQMHYRTAARLLGENGDPVEYATAHTGLGDAATLAGDYHEAIASYRLAHEAWLRDGNAVEAARALRRLGQTFWRQEAVMAARDAFEQAMALIGPLDSVDSAETLLLLADLHATSLGHTVAGNTYAEQALAMVERLGDRYLEATAFCVIGNVKARSNDLVTGQALLERALALSQELDDPALGAEASAHLANLYAWTGDFERSRKVSLWRATLAQRAQDPFHLRHVYAWMGLQETLQGHWSEAEQRFSEQEPIVEGLQSPEPRATLWAYRGILRYLQGQFERADQAFQQVIELLNPTGSGTLVWHLGWYGLVLAELGKRDDALNCFAELRRLTEELDLQARARGLAFAHLALGYARLGETKYAASCYEKLLPFQGQVSPVLIDRALGIAALAAGDHAAARQHLAEAEALARRTAMRPELALILIERGLLEARKSAMQPGAATNMWLVEALGLCEELAMLKHAHRALDFAHTASTPSHEPKQSHPAGLSDREVEVLRLVAQGKTNREIAAALVLSEKTVARHMTNIFNKILVENRASATAFALRHGLA